MSAGVFGKREDALRLTHGDTAVLDGLSEQYYNAFRRELTIAQVNECPSMVRPTIMEHLLDDEVREVLECRVGLAIIEVANLIYELARS
ncbi:hypothetical protein [Lancefieldella rimae]|uniref:hypothetical protein n=1 Tax=Lancefieldella rimae TaxID=1383 RepID=UPI0028803CA9|nr:hypothetical protein [Lancefieldella rimae]